MVCSPAALLTALVLATIRASLFAQSTPPAGVTDPGRSVWIEFTDPPNSRGLHLVESPEGKYRVLTVDGVPALTCDAAAGRLLYLMVDPWFTCADVTLSIEYYDCGTGRVGIRYDSSDDASVVDARFPGAFKSASALIECQGTNTWQRFSLPIPDARFAHCMNGADLRLELDVRGDFPIHAIWITADTDQPPLPLCSVGVVQPDGTTAWREAKPDESFVLKSPNYAQTLTPMGPTALQDLKAGVSLIAPGPPTVPVGFDVRKAPNSSLLSFDVSAMPVRMRVFGGTAPSAIEYGWGFEESLQVDLRVESADDERLAWHLSVRDREGSPLSIVNTGFAGLSRLKMGGAIDDDWFVCPGYAGHGAGVWHNLAAAEPGMLTMAMNWLSVYDKQSGIGLLLDDADDHDVYCLARTRDGALDVHFMLQGPLRGPVTAYHLMHGGDWHHVADAYRKQIAGREPRPAIPAWAQDCDGWDAFIGNDIDQGFSLMPYLWETRYAPNGLKLLDVYRAMYEGPWSYCGVYPYPCPWYGTPEELREANLRLRDHGYRTIYYINYQLSTPDGPEVKRIGPVARSFLPEGIPPPFGGQHGLVLEGRSYTGLPSEQTPMDRGSREWSDRDLFWARWYVENLAVDGIYWDQLSCIGGGLRETAWNLQRLTDECRRLNPDFITGGEGVGQAHGRSLTYGLASASFHRSELYRYTFPTHLVMDGTANGAVAWGGGDKRFNAIFLNGCRFDNLPNDPTFRQNTLNLRRRTKQLLYQAEFRDTVGITLSLPAGIQPVEPGNPGLQIAPVGGIQAKRFQLNTESSKLVLVNAVNDPGAPGARATVRTAGLGAIQAAWAFLWDGALKPLSFRQLSNAEVLVELPTSMQSTLVLLNRCEPLLYPEVPTMAAAGTTVPVKVTVLNLNAKPISGRLRWETPAGWSAEPAAFGPIASGKTAEVSSRLVVAADATRRPYDLFCVAETPDSAGRRYASLSVVPSPYLEWTWEPAGALKAIVVNFEERALEATVEAVLPGGGASIEPRTQSVSLPPRSQKEAFFTVHGAEAMSEPVGMRLVVTSGNRRYEVPIRLFPFIPNGSFEVDRAGDGKPEYWTTFDFSGKIEQADLYPLISLDTDRPFDGKYCLRVDPFTKADGLQVDVYPVGSMLSPNTTYRVVAYARVPEGGSLTLYSHFQPLQAVGVPDANGWQRYEAVGGTGATPGRNDFYLRNSGKTPVWVDGITFTPVTG